MNTVRRVGLVASLLFAALCGARWAFAVDTINTLSPAVGTQPVAQMGGDTPNTYAVSCSSNTLAAGATLLRPAFTADYLANQSKGRPLRQRCVQNTNSTAVVIGSSTVAAADYFQITNGTPFFCTNDTGAIYCAPATGNSAVTITVLEDVESVP